MLTNKKIGIRFFALVLTLLMVAAVFVGCNDANARKEAEEAKNKAEAAEKAAADAQDKAISAAKAADDLMAQLAAAQKEIDDAKDAAAKAQDELDKHLNEDTQPPVTDPGNINEDDFNQITALVTAEVLSGMSALRTQYLTIRQLWYTENNYYALAQLFDRAYIEVYRATTKEGVANVLAQLTVDAAAIANIKSDADAIQAKIVALGNVNTNVFTTNEDKVKEIETLYLTWLSNYRAYFTSNGLSVADYFANNNTVIKATDAHAKSTFGLNAEYITLAKDKIALLKERAKTAAEAAYLAIDNIWKTTEYSDLKSERSAIEAAYQLYKEYINANGGDDALITHTDKNVTPNRTLTGEEFVKLYVMVLYDHYFGQYKAAATDFINDLTLVFHNKLALEYNDYLNAPLLNKYLFYYNDFNDFTFKYEGSTIDAAADTALVMTDNGQLMGNFTTIVYNALGGYTNSTYSNSYKGTHTLNEAFAEVDRCIAKAAVEMVDLVYKTYLPGIMKTKMAGDRFNTDFSKYIYANSAEALVYYKTADQAFYDRAETVYNSYIDKFASYSVATYAQLDSVTTGTKIGDQRVFNISYDTNGDLVIAVNTASNPVDTALGAFNTAVKKIEIDYFENLRNLDQTINFYEFCKELAKEIDVYAAYATDPAKYITVAGGIDQVRKNGGSKELDDTAKKTLKDAATRYANTAKAELLALNYESYASKTYQAVNSSNKKLYHAESANGGTIDTESDKRVALNIVANKLVVAKDAAVTIFATNANKIVKDLLDLARTDMSSLIKKGLDLYNDKYDGDNSSVLADVAAYVAYLNSMTEKTALVGFKLTNLSLNGSALGAAATDTFTELVNAGYVREVVDSAKFINLFHIEDYYTAYNTGVEVAKTGTNSFTTLSDSEIVAFCALSTSSRTIYSRLEDVRSLAYHKADAILLLQDKLTLYKGVWDGEKNEWKTMPTVNKDSKDISYDYRASNSAKYRTELDKVYEKLVAEVQKISLLESATKEIDLTTAMAKVDKLVNDRSDAVAATVAKDAKSYDDLSFYVAWLRYSKVQSQYDWSLYNS